MKKLNIVNMLFLLLLPLLGACSKDEIIFDSELPRFETRPGYMLIEAIVPQSTSANDKIYIIGDFNGGMEAVGDPRWELEKAYDTDVKWGIYLNPADFINGKTLADGYTFYNSEQGVELTLEGTPAIHTDAPALGERLNVLLYRWKDSSLTPPSEIVHDGYAIYVIDHSGYDELALYAWGEAEIFGGWPGIKPTGKVEINGEVYKYFDTGAANEGLNVNLIFNNNGGGEQLDDYNVTLDQDYYLEVTSAGVVEYNPSVSHDGYTIFINDLSGWDELYLYMWGTVNDLNGAWPGMAPTGTQIINGVTYKYFDLGAANCDGTLEEHVILNNGNGTQFDEVVVFNLDRNVYIELTSTGATEIDPDNYTPGGTVTPDPTPNPDPTPDPTPGEESEYRILVENQTGWGELWIYSWGGNMEIFGGWPGMSANETVEIDGVRYEVFMINASGQSANLIFHNNAGTQYDALTLTMDKDYTIVAYPDKAELK